jgi:hypothetical protein
MDPRALTDASDGRIHARSRLSNVEAVLATEQGTTLTSRHSDAYVRKATVARRSVVPSALRLGKGIACSQCARCSASPSLESPLLWRSS